MFSMILTHVPYEFQPFRIAIVLINKRINIYSVDVDARSKNGSFISFTYRAVKDEGFGGGGKVPR